jgi:hypothetical protein
VKTGDLANTVGVLAEPPDETFDYETGVIDLLARPDEIHMGRDKLQLPRQPQQRTALVVVENGSRCQPVDERLED